MGNPLAPTISTSTSNLSEKELDHRRFWNGLLMREKNDWISVSDRGTFHGGGVTPSGLQS